MDVDVCVVGAGYAGLTAARRVAQAGQSVAVLEARDRIGGRVWTRRSEGGVALDMGGTFVGPDQDRLLALGEELGVTTYRTYDSGQNLLATGGKFRRYVSNKTPRLSPIALASAGQAMLRLNAMAKTVPLDAPWTAPKAAEWDAMTARGWLSSGRVPTKTARDLLEATLHALFCVELSEVSLLHVLFLIHSGGRLENFMNIEGGYQERMWNGGAQTIADRMAAELGDAVVLNAPVLSVKHRPDSVEVGCADLVVGARHVIISTPPSLASRIDFDPPLPADHAILRHKAPAGTEIKVNLVFDTPFWRADGLSGASAAMDDPFEVTLDASPAEAEQGVLSLFASAAKARAMWRMSAAERRTIVLDIVTKRFGPTGASPLEYHEQNWAEEQWSRGCSMAHFGAGVLTQFGMFLRQPLGRIHWAGTETAGKSHGAIDGAVRSGERAAAEVIQGVDHIAVGAMMVV
jgi:monoamine oxidase